MTDSAGDLSDLATAIHKAHKKAKKYIVKIAQETSNANPEFATSLNENLKITLERIEGRKGIAPQLFASENPTSVFQVLAKHDMLANASGKSLSPPDCLVQQYLIAFRQNLLKIMLPDSKSAAETARKQGGGIQR